MFPQNPTRLVIVVNTMMVTFVPSQTSLAVGGVKVHAVPHSNVKARPQFMDGGVVSTTRTVWLHVERFVQASNASQVRVALNALPQRLRCSARTVITAPVSQLVTVRARRAAFDIL